MIAVPVNASDGTNVVGEMMGEFENIGYDDKSKMAAAILGHIKSDDPVGLSELLEQDSFWAGRSYDAFSMQSLSNHLIGLCLEHGAKVCAQHLLKSNLVDLNVHDFNDNRIEPALHQALESGSNDVVALLINSHVIAPIESSQGDTLLETALIHGNRIGAKLVATYFPDMLRHDNKAGKGAHYHQQSFLKYAVLSGDIEPLSFVIKNSRPSNVVYLESGVNALYADQGIRDELADRLFELGLDANEMLDIVLSEAHPNKHDLSVWQINKCLEYGAEFSFNNYHEVLAMAAEPSADCLSVLNDCEFDINENNGAILKASVETLSANIFSKLIEAGADPKLLDKPVIDYIDDPKSLTGYQLDELAAMQSSVDSFVAKNERAPYYPIPPIP